MSGLRVKHFFSAFHYGRLPSLFAPLNAPTKSEAAMISQLTLAIAIVVAFVIGAVLIFRTVQDMRSVHKAVKRERARSAEIGGSDGN